MNRSYFFVRWAFAFLAAYSIYAYPAASLAQEPGTAQLARFAPWMKTLDQLLRSDTSPQKVADRLLESQARVAAFNLQALGKLYSDEDKLFDRLRSEFKNLEDAIGEFDKWRKIYEKYVEKLQESGHSPAEVKEKSDPYRKKAEQARRDFTKMLVDDRWVVPAGSDDGTSRLRAIWKSLQKDVQWLDYMKDRELMLGVLAKQLKKVDQTEFDFSRLEEGDGLHEFRRELRWFTIEARVLNGMLQFRPNPNACPIDRFAALVHDKNLTSGKYSTLPSSATEISPCLVSQCLFLAVVKMVEDVGELKDKAERITKGETDEVPAEIRKKAEKIYSAMKESELLPTFRDELKTCKD